MKKLYVLTVLAIAIAPSCKKFLEEDPKGLIATATYYKTSADAISAINGVYAATRADAANNIDATWISEMGSDDATAAGTAVGERLEIESLTFTAENAYVQRTWQTAYNVITRANNVIANVDSAIIPAPIVRRVLAEARFLRALFYTRLIQYYGDVPLVTEPASSANLYPKRASKLEICNQIIADLKNAELYLDDKYAYSDAQNSGRATKAAAKAQLGYVYLLMAGNPINDASKYQLAADKLKEVIDQRTTYGITLMASYKDMFDVSKKTANTENIFFYRGASGFASGLLAYTRFHYWYYAFTAVAPSKQVITGLYETADLRRKVAMARKKSNATVDIDDPTSQNNQPVINKYIDLANGTDNINDYPLLRYGDVLLMRAEALMELGGATNMNEALSLINQVRITHGGTGLSPLTYTDQADLRTKLRLERRRELLFEGKRWFDLARWGTLISSIKAGLASQNNLPVSTYDYINDKSLLLPLPYTDYVANENLRPQNPGY